MNDGVRKIGIVMAAGATLALGACMSDPSGDEPALLAQINAAVNAPGTRPPSFAEVPVKPTDMRTPVQWRTAVGDEEAARQRVLADTAPATFALKGDTDAFAARARAEATNDAPAAPTAADRKESEAYAASLREQASPPSSTPR
jgi:hypothetical protein